MVNVALYSLLEFASAFAPNLTVFLVLRALYGVAMGCEWGTGAALTMEKLRSPIGRSHSDTEPASAWPRDQAAGRVPCGLLAYGSLISSVQDATRASRVCFR